MKNVFLTTIFLLIGSMSLSSCGIEEETTTPSFQVHTVSTQMNMRTELNALSINDRDDESVNQIIRERIEARALTSSTDEEFSINLRYPFDSSEFIDPPQQNSYNAIGSLIAGIGKIFASIFIGITGPMDVDVPPFLVTVPLEMKLDMNIIRSITIQQVTLESEDTDFSFINDFKIDFLNHTGEGRSPLLLSYTKPADNGAKNKTTLNFGLQKINLVPYLKPDEILNFKPSLSIGRLPPKNIHFKGNIVFKVTLKLPF